MRNVEDFLCFTQKELMAELCVIFKGKCILSPKEFLLVKGEVPVLLVAHMDTVHKEPVRDICRSEDGEIIMSPQGIGGDDRCGIYAIVTAYEKASKKPWLLFTCNEEIGCLGAKAFAKRYRHRELPKSLDTMKMIIEVDRKGANDAVYYDCDNPEFEAYVSSMGFVTDHGSGSDIKYFAPDLKTAAVNLSSGYYNEHRLWEHIVRSEIEATTERVILMVADAAAPDFPRYEFREKPKPAAFYSYSGPKKSGKSFGKSKSSKSCKKVEDDYQYYGSFDMTNPIWNVPSEIRPEYEALLENYTSSVLDEMRAKYGDGIIVELFKSDFGSWSNYEDMRRGTKCGVI